MVPAGFALGLGLFAALLLGGLTAVAWRLLARRWPRAGAAVVVVGALLVAGCFLPPTRSREVMALQGSATGTAWVPVVAGEGAAVRAQGGAADVARLPNGTWLRLDCPAGCTFQGGTRGDDPAASLGVDALQAPGATVQGTVTLTSTLVGCVRLPVVVGLAFGASDCAPCYDAVFVTDAEGRLAGSAGAAC